MSETVLIENRKKLRIIKINRPKKKNAINSEIYNRIITALNEAATDDSVNVVALTGVGDMYSAGNDIAARATLKGTMAEIVEASTQRLFDYVRSFYSFPKILIAVVNGPCIGIAATTAALCDVVYASETAYFYTPFTQLGICPEGCSTYTFPKILGVSKANEMLLLNHKMDVNEALKYNFISEIFKNEDIEKIWLKLENFAELPANALKISKSLVKKMDYEYLEKANLLETGTVSERFFSDEARNAATKFMNRSKL